MLIFFSPPQGVLFSRITPHSLHYQLMWRIFRCSARLRRSFVNFFRFFLAACFDTHTNTRTHGARVRFGGVRAFSTFQYVRVTSHATPGCRLPRVPHFPNSSPLRRLRIVFRCLPGADGRPLAFLFPSVVVLFPPRVLSQRHSTCLFVRFGFALREYLAERDARLPVQSNSG